MLELYFTIAVKFVFLFAPFFVVTMFLALTRGEPAHVKHRIVYRSIFAAAAICVILFFVGPLLFDIIGITLNSFRIGSGSLLFLTAVSLVNSGTRNHAKGLPDEERDDVSVVPLAIPFIVGPATIGTILVLGAELPSFSETFVGMLGMLSALLVLGGMLLLSPMLENALGKTGLNILSKVSGLILAAMAAEIVFTGVVGFLGLKG